MIRPGTTLRPELDAISAAELDVVARRLRIAVDAEDVIEDVHRLSPVQEAMLFHAVGSEADDLYIVQQRLEIDGQLEFEPFQQAWNLVMGRHDALRSMFSWRHAGKPVQIVCAGVSVAIELVDLSSVDRPEHVIGQAFAADRGRRFDLESPPLMRIALFRLAPDSHVMLWSQHHLLQDGWSSSVVLTEVFTAYEALVAGAEPELPPVRPFREYIDWLEEQDRDGTAAFWRDHFAGFTQPTRMVGPGRAATSGDYTRLFRALTPELTVGLRTLARTNRVSLNTVLVAGLAVVLGRYAGRPDVAFGTVASGRPPTLPGVESMVGMFINTVALRIEVELDLSVAEWLPKVQSRQASLFDHEHSALPDVQSWSELRPGNSLTDVLFAYWNFGGAGTSPSGVVSYKTVEGYGRTSFPFSITVEGADPLNIGLDFDTGDIEAESAERFLAHYANVLASMVATPDEPVGSLRMLTDSERRAMVALNATEMPVPCDTVLAAFAAQVAASPDDIAASCEAASLTYAELDRASDRLARHLLTESPERVRRVAIFLTRSLDTLVAILGTLKAGGAYVPVDRHHPPERVGLIISESEADIVITSTDLADVVDGSGASIVQLPLDGGSDEGGGEAADAIELPHVSADDLAYVIFTSGSTGVPKGVMIRHGALLNYVWWAAQAYGNGRPTTFPLYSSVAFDLTVTSIYVPLITGGQVVAYPDTDARDLSVLQVFEDDRVDVVKLTPSHLAVLEPRHFATSRIHSLILGGEDLKVVVAQSVVAASAGRLRLFNEYGPTEATVGCMIHQFDPDADTEGSVPIGRPAGNARIYLLDEALIPVPAGAVGELYIGGAGVADGYLNRPDLTAESFLPDPSQPGALMYRSGDQARWRHDGSIEYLGRSDDQVKVRGYRLEPAEIEAVLATHDTVVEAAVAVREPRPGDVRLAAYYVPEPDAATNLTDLRAHLHDHLPAYMVPPHLVQMDALPLTPNGKLDRAALPESLGESTSRDQHIAPRNAAERLVAAKTAELLGVEQVSMSDNFFDLGGHSILAMQLIAQLHAATDIRISPRVILLNTLDQAAALLPAVDEPDAAHVAVAQAGDAERRMGASAYFFGPSDGPLFGLRYTPTGDGIREHSVLICPPVGWEYMRTHRALRGLGRRLGLEGFSVLRFDYFGTGDSYGQDGSGDIDRWVEDIATAATELRAETGSGRLTIIGMRLGATLAVSAARAGLDVDDLVLWDPIVRGEEHLADLERMHAEMLANRTSGTVPEGLLGDELLGFRYPMRLRAGLLKLDLAAAAWPAVPTTVVASQARPEYSLLDDTRHGALTVEVVEDAGAWDDLASAQAALLPTNIPSHLIDLLRGGR